MYTTMKNVPQLIVVIFSLFVLYVHSWENEVIVDQELNVTNDCIQDSNNMTLLCATINSALRNLKIDSTVIYIRPGNYTLRNGRETYIIHKQDIAIIGSGEDSIITCTEYTGLGVLYSENITIEYIVMKGCGKKYQLDISYTESCVVNIALYFDKIYNIRLDSVVIRDSKEISVYVAGDDDCPSDFIINNCSIVKGSVAESSQNSIVGGIVINIYSWGSTGTVRLSNSSIINNGGGTQSHDVNCSPIDAVAGIVVIRSPAKLIIDSCVITDNTRGLVVYDESADVRISNTVLFNQVNNIEVVLRKYYSSVYISIYGDTLSDFTIVTLDHFPALIFHCSANGCSFGNDYLNISVGHESHDGSDFSLQINETNFNNCLAFPPIGICSNHREDYRGHCPPSYSHCFANYCTCSEGRNGTLCGQCADGYSVAINSPYMSCVPCNSSTVYKGWALLIALEFIPTTVMVSIIAVLNVNLNQGSLSGYIFLCQMFTIPFPSVGYPSWLVSVTTLYDRNQLLLFSLLPLSIWNIGFIYYPSNFFVDLLDYPLQYNPVSICVSQSTTSLAYHIFWYIISFYPLVLALLIYCVIVMYDKGYRCVVCVVRPMHRLLARFWRLFDIQPSLSHTVASLYTLCFTQLAATSLKILHPTVYTDTESQNHTVFFYDGSQPYFSGVHGFACTVAILVLVLLFITVAYLVLHPFKLFQWCFGKLNFRKDLVISVTDVFNGPFKDGTSENSWDYRYFAGMHFAIQLVVMTFYYIPLEHILITGSLKMTVCSLYLLAILIFRPYKRNIHNFSEVLLFVLLAGFSVFLTLVFDRLGGNQYIFFNFVVIIFGFIIIVFVIPYCLFWMIRKCCHCCKYIKDNYTKHNNVPLEDLHEKLITNSGDGAEDNVMFADRLMNPEQYKSTSLSARGINISEESDCGTV